jgi:hypothetical protein
MLKQILLATLKITLTETIALLINQYRLTKGDQKAESLKAAIKATFLELQDLTQKSKIATLLIQIILEATNQAI